MNGNLTDLFRSLRRHWFASHVRLHAPERQWETEEEEAAREKINDRARTVYDAQTEELILGHDRPLAPRCLADLQR